MSRTFRNSDIFEFCKERHNKASKIDKKHLRMKVPDGKIHSFLYDKFTDDGEGVIGFQEEVCDSHTKKILKRIRNKKKRKHHIEEE